MLARLLACIILGFALTACGADSDAPGAGGMTVGENERLEAAAERLENRAPSPAQADAAALEADVAERLAAEAQAQPQTQPQPAAE